MSSWRGGEPTGNERRSWRKTAKAAPTAAGGKYWASGSGSKPLFSGNVVRLFVALVALGATTVGIVVNLFNTNLSTPLVSIATIDYEHPWGPNAWATEDQTHLLGLSESSQFKVAIKQQKKEEATWEQLIELELEKTTPGGPGGSLIPALWGYGTLIVHLSAHGVLNGANEPCLLFADADPLDDRTWVPVNKVLTAIGEHQHVTNGDVRVLVVLDTGKQPPDIRCGLLATGFIEEARESIQKLNFANFAVLLPCAEDQCAWTAPEMGGTVFGVMVVSGLQGQADTLAGNANRRLTVQELARFVALAVNGYVRENRGRAQNPNLVWCGENQDGDFELCHCSSYSTSPASAYASNSRIGKLAEAWKAFEDWSVKAPSHAAWQRATAIARLARAEQLLWGGASYQSQFESELREAFRTIDTSVQNRWPGSICGGSLAFLNRVHGIDAEAELQAAGLGPVVGTAPKQQPTPAPEGVTEGVTEGAAAAGGPSATNQTAAAKPAEPPAEEAPTPGEKIVQWLSFDPSGAGDQPPPERPELPDRHLAISFLTTWLSANPQVVNSQVTQRVVEWLGPIVDRRSVTREEALLRTIAAHLQLTSTWNLAAQNRLGQLWSQYLSTAEACELALACVDPRGTQTLQRESVRLTSNLQVVRDHIHGCETQSDALDCANELIVLQAEAKLVLDIRQRLERSWKLRDELAFELPTFAQWISSPVGRMQTLVSPTMVWGLSGQLGQHLQSLQTQLTSGKIPELEELAGIDGEFDQLITAYSRSMDELIRLSAKGQRKALGDVSFSLGLRPNVFRGPAITERAKLHHDLDRRYSDLTAVYGDEQLQTYCEVAQAAGNENEPVWRLGDLPTELTPGYVPLFFTETATGRPLATAQATALEPRAKWAALGGELRSVWNKLPAQLAENCQASVEAMSSQDEASIAEDEEKLMASEYQSHLISQLIPSQRLNVLPLPIRLTQEVCSEQFALWQGRRALADFWRTPALPQSTDSLFMLASAEDWKSSVLSPPARGPVKLFEQRQLEATARAKSWEVVWQNVTAAEPPENKWQADLSLDDFPTGLAWVRLALNGNSSQPQPLENRRFQTQYQTGRSASTPAIFSLSTSNLPEGNHDLTAWFRGHVASAAIPIYQRKPPVILAWQTEEPGQTTIRVEAEPKPARIVFVLDCSGSMKAAGMQAAKHTLLEVIRGLSKSNAGQTEIAVVLFGHTAEYGGLGLPDGNSSWPGPRNRPYNDVETIQDLATPTPQILSKLQSTLANLEHHGRTPLYESIIRAIDLLLNRHDGFAGDQRVVVITDGNDKILPLRGGLSANVNNRGLWQVPSQYIHTEQDPIKRAAGRVSLDFVAFKFDGDEGGLTKLTTMASATGGKVYEAGVVNLADQLRNSIARNTFSTKNLKTQRSIGTRVRFSDEQRIAADQLAGQFEVQIDDTAERKAVALLGGETIEMQYRSAGGLTFLPYAEGDQHPLLGAFMRDGQKYEAMMLTGVPDSIPQVRICLQSLNSNLQSLRPDQFLLELQRTTPGQNDQGQRVAWTSDALWENHHRSPVLRVVMKNAPEMQQDRLECRLWIANKTGVNPAVSLPLARLKEQPVEIAPGINASADTERTAGGLRVIVTETRQPEAQLVHWRVLPAPDRSAEHQVYETKVIHEYFFTDATLLNKIEFLATPLPAVPDEAWTATPWIQVPRWR